MPTHRQIEGTQFVSSQRISTCSTQTHMLNSNTIAARVLSTYGLFKGFDEVQAVSVPTHRQIEGTQFVSSQRVSTCNTQTHMSISNPIGPRVVSTCGSCNFLDEGIAISMPTHGQIEGT